MTTTKTATTKTATATAMGNAVVKREYLEGIDSLFVAAEDAFHLMTVATLYRFKNKMNPASLKRDLAAFIAPKDRFQMKVVVPSRKELLSRPYFVTDTSFSMDNHFSEVELSGNGGKAELEAIISKEFSAKFDFSKPLWSSTFIGGPNGESYLFVKAHHCIADGQGFVRLLLTFMANLDPNMKDPASMMYVAGRNVAKTGSIPSVTENATQPPTAIPPAKTALLMNDGSNSGTDSDYPGVREQKKVAPAPQGGTVTHKKQSPAGPLVILAIIWLKLVATLVYIVDTIRFVSSNQRSFSRSKQTPNKQVSWSSHVTLADVKMVKQAFGATVNDVLLATLSGAIERYLRERSKMFDSNFYFLIPTSLRLHSDWSITNRSSAYILNVPVTNGNHRKAIRSIHERMNVKKNNPEAAVNFGGSGALFFYPNLVPEWLKQWSARNVTAVVTNVPGPMEPLLWGGEPIDALTSFIPQAHPNSLGCTIYTYQGQVAVSVMMDEDEHDLLFCPGAAASICGLFDEAFEEIKAMALQAGSPQKKKN
ncbi:wax ester synthase-like acyl-CoA acyltransferase domain-containing protein [Zopfochytrium polystomum]|nr:wax ester synthase-like acyl-CoA acyltransferase domain-containing protein [Zopfochytrium polystomum]